MGKGTILSLRRRKPNLRKRSLAPDTKTPKRMQRADENKRHEEFRTPC